MRESFPTELLLRFLHAEPEELDYIQGYFARRALRRALPGSEAALPGRGSAAEARGAPESPSRPVYVFRWTGRDWNVICGWGKGFYLEDMLASRLSNYMLHEPNEAITAVELEIRVQPEKAAARAWNSIQCDSDGQSLREYRQEVGRLLAARELAQAAGKPEEVARLAAEIREYERLLRGGGPADTGRRAYDNVRQAFRVLRKWLCQRGQEERFFAQHLRDHLSIGYECYYNSPEGRIWE